MGTIIDPSSSTKGFIFTPNNPRLPVELFLSIIESDAASSQDLGTPSSLLIAQTLSFIDLSEIEDEVFESLQEQKTWEDFKCEMIKQFHLTDTFRNKVELIKGAFKQDGEDVRHFVIRARHTADTMKKFNTEELARLLFLAGLPDKETNFCFNNTDVNRHDLDILADLINSHSGNINMLKESSKSPVAENIEESDEEQKPGFDLSENDTSSSVENQTDSEDSSNIAVSGDLDTKPDYSFKALIIMAIQSHPHQRMNLQEIYSFICTTFPYYGNMDNKSGWQNAIRHNLSLGKDIFEREKISGVKGAWWRLKPNVDLRKHCRIKSGVFLPCKEQNLADPLNSSMAEEPTKDEVSNGSTTLVTDSQILAKERSDDSVPINQENSVDIDDMPFSCSLCGKKFTRKGTLNKHVDIEHSDDKPFSCSICGKKFTRKGTLKEHEGIHAGDKPFSCIQCNYECTRSWHLKRHKRAHHTGLKGNYKCSKSGNSMKHKRIPTGDKPFSCSHCDYKCSTATNFKRHERIHKGDCSTAKPFNYPHCVDQETEIDMKEGKNESQDIINQVEESSESLVDQKIENIQTIEFVEENEFFDQETGIVLKEVNVKKEEILVIENVPTANDALQDMTEHGCSGERNEGRLSEGHAITPHQNSILTLNQPNPHPKPNLTIAQLIIEVLVDAPQDGFTSREIMCKIGRKHPFYKFDTSRSSRGKPNWTQKVQKIISDAKETFTGVGEQGEKKWTLRKGNEILILKRLGWQESDRNDVALLDVFLESFGPEKRTSDKYINRASTLGLVANKSVETVRLIYQFWAKDYANVPVLKKKCANVAVLKKKSTNIPHLMSTNNQICVSPIKPMKRKPPVTEAGAVVPKFTKFDPDSAHDESKVEVNMSTTNEEPVANKAFAAQPTVAESSLFACDQCDFKTELAVWLETHKRKGHIPTYHCPEQGCFYQTRPIKNSEEEIKKYHSRINYHLEHPHFSKGEDGVYHCPQLCCRDKDTKFKGKFKSQILNHLKCGSKKDIICEICANIFTNEYKLKDHITRDHGGEARFSCHHNECGFRTNHEPHFKTHLQRVHYEDGGFSCEKCPYRTGHLSNLERHMNSHADVSERTFYGCVLCEYTATQKVNLRIHMETKHKVKLADYRILRGRNKELGPQSKPRAEGSTPHSAIQDWIETGKLIKGTSGQILSEQQTSPDVSIENKMKCQLCQEPLDGSKHAFLQHVRSHPKEQRFECKDCPDRKRYPNILPFFEHRHNKHGLPYPSGLEVYICRASVSCKFQSLMRTSVIQHMECVHGPLSDKKKMYRAQQKIKRLPCPHCPAMFATMQQLNNHIEVHTQSLEDRKIHNCPTCNQKFASPIHLRTHYKAIHLKIREYRCKICDLKFGNTGNLKEHIGIKHLGYANAKEWRKSENKSVRDKVTKHEAYEYIPFKWKDEYMKVDGEQLVES